MKYNLTMQSLEENRVVAVEVAEAEAVVELVVAAVVVVSAEEQIGELEFWFKILPLNGDCIF